MSYNEMGPADIRAVTGNDNNGMFGNDWAWIIILLLFGYGGRGFGNWGGNGGGNGYPCATQADVRAAVDQQTLISKLDNQTYGLADSTYALNNAITGGFAQAELSRCNQQAALMAQLNNIMFANQQCCCDTRATIKDGYTMLQKQISDCCCDVEKMNMQSRFDAQAFNCNTLQAIDKLGDRLENRLNNMESARIREQLDAERTKNAVLQGQIDRAQLRYDIVNDVRPCPQPAYITCNPYATSCGGNCSNF